MPDAVNSVGFPLLTIILFFPAAVGLAVLMVLEDVRTIRIVSAATAIIEFLLAAVLLAKFDIGAGGFLVRTPQWVFQFSDKHSWIPSLGISYWIGVDGVSVFLVGLTALVLAIAILAATFMINDRVKAFMVFMLFLESAVVGVFVSLNLFLFYVFWEAMLIPMYFLLGMWGEERRQFATVKFIIYTIFGSFLMLVAIFYLWTQRGTLNMAGPGGLIAHPLAAGLQTWLFFAFTLAFAIKLPLWPFHSWAPDAYGAAPIPVVIPLAGILSKAGAFGLLRYSVALFPHAAREFAALIAVLAIVGILYAAVLALVQRDIKQIVAYSSISHMNLIALGIFALNPISFDGSVLQMINHGVIMTGLFLAVAYIVARTGSRSLTDMGGLGRRLPILMWLFFVFVLAALDLPGLNSFTGEFLILVGVFKTNAWFAGIAAAVTILAAWYMIRFFQNSMNGPVVASPAAVAETVESPERTVYQFPVARRLLPGDLLPREIALFVPLILVILYLGIQPNPVTTRLNPTTNSLSSTVHSASPPSGAKP